MGLALANAATQGPSDTFMLIDDLGIFDGPETAPMGIPQGILGLNF